VTAVDPDFDIIDMPFDDYVIKPVSRDNLFGTIDRLLTCSEYEETLRKFYSLTAKQAALRANKPDVELEASDEFAELQTRIDELRDRLADTVSSFDDEDFAAIFRDLGGRSVHAGTVDE
jgi:DNA-binding response OmpR family regulator